MITGIWRRTTPAALIVAASCAGCAAPQPPPRDVPDLLSRLSLPIDPADYETTARKLGIEPERFVTYVETPFGQRSIMSIRYIDNKDVPYLAGVKVTLRVMFKEIPANGQSTYTDRVVRQDIVIRTKTCISIVDLQKKFGAGDVEPALHFGHDYRWIFSQSRDLVSGMVAIPDRSRHEASDCIGEFYLGYELLPH